MLTENNMAQSFLNSLLITIPATVIPILVAAYAAYAFAWMDFPGRNLLFILVVGLLVIPLQSSLIPVLQLSTNLGMTGTFPAVWLAHTGFGLPFAIFLLRNFFGQLPREMFESAYLDGASPTTAFFRLVLPLSVPAIASLVIFQFMFVWNDLLVALILVGGTTDVAPMTVTIANLVNSLGPGLAPADRRGVHQHDPAAGRVLQPAALLRARHPGRVGQGLELPRSGHPGQDLLAVEGP